VDVTTLRNYVRDQMEVDDEELPDRLLNIYLQEAFDRTMAFDNRWPRYEKIWPLAKVAGADTITLPPDLNVPAIISVISMTDNFRLTMINHENAEDSFAPLYQTGSGVGTPAYYSLWAGQMYLWPRVDTAASYDLLLRAYRQPVWSNGASDIPDLDTRLHATLAYFAISLAYAAQEDEILEGVYLARWDRDLRSQMRAILEPVHHRPLVMHGGAPVGGVPSYVIVPPTNGA
jgi:pimeloyl-ACP methyl ester carboxylesterase